MGIKDGASKAASGAKAAAAKSVELSKATAVGYARGLTYPFKGLKFVFFQHPALVRFWIFPILITLVLLTVSFWGSYAVHQDVTNWMWEDPTTQTAEGAAHKTFPPTDVDKIKPTTTGAKQLDSGGDFWSSAGHWVHWTVELMVLLLLWTLSLLAVVLLTNIVAAPFNDFLSEEVERLVTGREGAPFSLAVLMRDTVRTVGLEVLKLLIYLVVMVPLWLLSLLFPVVGQVIYTIFAFVFTAIYFSLDYIDWPASRRDRSVTYRFGLLTEHFLPMLGFGSGVWLFLFIPIVNLLFMPAAVAGGTLLFLDLEGQVGEPEPQF